MPRLRSLPARPGGLRGRAASFGHAARGLLAMLRTQPNARIHAGAALAVVAAGLFFRVSRPEWCWLVAAIVAVFTAEAFNTALEALADAHSADPHPLVGRAKDAAAGAVLVAALGAAVVGLLVLGPHLLAWLAVPR